MRGRPGHDAMAVIGAELAGLRACRRLPTLAGFEGAPGRWPAGRAGARGDACRLPIPYCPHSVGEPLVDWQAGEALARRRRAHERAFDHTGLDEVWLAGPTVIEQ